jgi:uncharacterized membrane protein (UPF0127 family)
MLVNVINLTRSLEKPLRVKNCETFLCRLKGLMFTNHIDPDAGLLLVHKKESRGNAAIHMFFVGMDLGVIWLNDDQEIVDLLMAKSWAPIFTPRVPARFILEIHPDRLPEFKIGDRLNFE